MPRPCHNEHALSPETCPICRKVLSSKRHREAWGEDDPGAGVWERLGRFTAAVASHVMHGMPEATEQQYSRRVSICDSCPELVQPGRVCRVCKCFVDRKAKMAGQYCPLGKWADNPTFHFLPNLADPLCEPPDPSHGREWAAHPQVRQSHLDAWRKVCDLDMGKPPIAEGNGVIICGGGKYWPMALASATMVRQLAPHLPIEIWHRGSVEPVIREDAEALGNCVAIDWEQRNLGYTPRQRGGWQQKLIALTGTHFRRVLFLDADAYPVVDPTPLFALLDDAPFCYWRDLEPMARNYQPEALGMQPSDIGPVQGGQLIIDRAAFWRPLALTHWLCQHSEYSFNSVGYGDQDQWVPAIQATEAKVKCLGRARLFPPGLWFDLDKRPVIIHRPGAKLYAPWDGDAPKWMFHTPREAELRRAFEQAVGNTPAERFRKLVQLGGWGRPGDSAGGGREADEGPFVELVNALLRFAGVQSLCDLGCGDTRVAAQLDCPSKRLVDVHDLPPGKVPSKGCSYHQVDLYAQRDQLPGAEVALCRDVLHHWPTAEACDFLRWCASRGPWKWLIVSWDWTDASGPRRCEWGAYAAMPADLSAYGCPPLTRLVRLDRKDVFLLKCAKG